MNKVELLLNFFRKTYTLNSVLKCVLGNYLYSKTKLYFSGRNYFLLENIFSVKDLE